VVKEKESIMSEEMKTELTQRKDITDVVVNSFEDMQRMAKMFAASDLVPDHLRNKPNNVLIILQTAKELGIGPLQAIDIVDVIKGKRGIKPEGQVALIRSRVPEAYIKIEVDEEKKSVSCTMAPSRARMDEAYTSTWDVARATAMGLMGQDNYKKQLLTMLKWRAIGDAGRSVFPHVTRGLYNTVELEDFVAGPSSEGPKLKEIFQAKATVVTGETEHVPVAEVESSGLDIEN
jgi:hypothetical protein